MNKLLDLLLSMLGSNFDWTKLLGELAERLLANVYTPGGCKEYVISHLKAGTLDDEFKKNPVGVIVCLGHVAMSLADLLDDHDHDPAKQPIMDASWVSDLATATGTEVPAEGAGSPLAGILLQIVVAILARYLKTQE